MYTEQELTAQGYKAASAEYFTGKAWLKPLVTPDNDTNCIISDVLFEPGTRNNWHTHGSNQILIIKTGTCYYQEEGQAVQKVEAGGVINVLPGVKHWHGASPDNIMIHTAIGINTEKGIVNWLEPVTDKQYLP
ncbi:cupin domain-containing protein [Mucilaginibacter sp.]|uniref:cupin domain-containing protein n=1 Tax=Mucilaginibacter sp. TaxID=1882438 RepID=UPI000CB9A677|nr:cupin domain-containing protein [Mucilaginibacter sp.]PLW90268.1 MAG: cupin domain-containing protein [Mucilaginibacter sp.]HEK19318.1 cupin domain-containing protein [Bacteroidota bacterium]